MRRSLAPSILGLLLACTVAACGESGGDGDGETGEASGSAGEAGEADSGPTSEWCDPTDDWDPASAAFEEEVLSLVNQARAQGADCGSAGSFGAAPPLGMQSQLRCAARMHSLDMEVRGFFNHSNPDGDGPAQRAEFAGYSWSAIGENIAQGYPTPQAVMDGWMGSDGHCSNIMGSQYSHIGVGHYEGNQWTQVFGSPR